jgi:hypothetical protein
MMLDGMYSEVQLRDGRRRWLLRSLGC